MTVIGCSRDSVRSHQKFKEKHDIPFTLLSDPGGVVAEKYDVLKEKQMYGRTVKGINRSTFVIDEEGNVTQALYGVSAKGHVRELVKTLT